MKKNNSRRQLFRRSNILILISILFCIVVCLLSITVLAMREHNKVVDKEEEPKRTQAEEPATTESLEETIKKQIPILYQTDERWGYLTYGSGPIRETGCGPTCLSMVAMYQLQNVAYTPDWMAEYSTKMGYCSPGNGTSWTFMTEGASALGLNPTQINPIKDRVLSYLSMGKPIICVMGPGQFTDKGHFIVLTGVVGDKIKIHDPNSEAHTNRLWDYEEFVDEIKNLWVYY